MAYWCQTTPARIATRFFVPDPRSRHLFLATRVRRSCALSWCHRRRRRRQIRRQQEVLPGVFRPLLPPQVLSPTSPKVEGVVTSHLVGTGGVPVGPASRAVYGSTAATKTALGSTRVGCVRHGIQTMKTLGSGRKIVRDKNHRTKGLFLICTRNCQLPQGSMKIVLFLYVGTPQSSSIQVPLIG